MKILDRYVAKNFLIGYFISMAVLVGLRVVIDLFVNVDEFAQLADRLDLNSAQVLGRIFSYYGIQSTLYFRDFAGIITVVAAVFSLGKMTRNNELIAIMASGISLKRVIMPIILLSIMLTGLLIVDQEILIPRFANHLVRTHDATPGQEAYELWFMSDSNGSLVCTRKFDEMTQQMYKPTIIKRQKAANGQWEVVGRIIADMATYNDSLERWDLKNGVYTTLSIHDETESYDLARPQEVEFYKSDLVPYDIPIRRQEGYKALLSSAQLAVLVRNQARIKDKAELHSQRHFRFTDPIVNIIMLLVSLPVLVCRDPKAMKTSVVVSFVITLACFITLFTCKMLATEVFFGQVRPAFWAWLPIIIFMPIALIEIDSMKT